MTVRSRASLLLLLPPVVVASVRTWCLCRSLPLDLACHMLAEVRPLPPTLRDPAGCLRLVNRLLRVLPPRGLGPCFKRSLLLLDLWSRCGLEPRLHLGVRQSLDRRHGHAWVTVADRPDLSAGETGFNEAFVWRGAGPESKMARRAWRGRYEATEKRCFDEPGLRESATCPAWHPTNEAASP